MTFKTTLTADSSPEEVRAEWVRALRSGEFRQTRGVLKRAPDADGPSYCCLGVLCELAAQAGLGYWTTRGSSLGAESFITEEQGLQLAVLPPVVQEWAGLSHDNGEMDVRVDENPSLASFNDYFMRDVLPGQEVFNRVADLIESGKVLTQ